MLIALLVCPDYASRYLPVVETRAHSCAIFGRPDGLLADAQVAKIDRICAQLQLAPDDHVLEIGCDWGGTHYAETLRRWNANLREAQGEVRALGYDTTFDRTWDFYLAFCEAAFRTRALRDAQLTLTRSGGYRGCT